MHYAGFGPRAWAAVLDALVLWVLSCAYWLAASVPWDMARHLAVPYVCAPALYNMVCLAAWGQTLGKRWARIQVVGTSGEPIGPSQAALRHSVDALLAVPMAFAWAAALQAVGPAVLAGTPLAQRPTLGQRKASAGP